MLIGQSQVVLAVEQLADWLRESVFEVMVVQGFALFLLLPKCP